MDQKTTCFYFYVASKEADTQKLYRIVVARVKFEGTQKGIILVRKFNSLLMR